MEEKYEEYNEALQTLTKRQQEFINWWSNVSDKSKIKVCDIAKRLMFGDSIILTDLNSGLHYLNPLVARENLYNEYANKYCIFTKTYIFPKDTVIVCLTINPDQGVI